MSTESGHGDGPPGRPSLGPKRRTVMFATPSASSAAPSATPSPTTEIDNRITSQSSEPSISTTPKPLGSIPTSHSSTSIDSNYSRTMTPIAKLELGNLSTFLAEAGKVRSPSMNADMAIPMSSESAIASSASVDSFKSARSMSRTPSNRSEARTIAYESSLLVDTKDLFAEMEFSGEEMFSKQRLLTTKRINTLNSNVEDSQQIRRFLNPIGLWMKNSELEAEFVSSPSFTSTFMSIKLVRVVHALIVAALIGFAIYAGVSRNNTNLMWIALICGNILFIALIYTLSPWFRVATARQYTLWLSFVAVSVAISSTLVITDNGVFSLTLFSTIVIGVFQGRFFPSFCVCIFDLIFYNIGRIWINDGVVSAPSLVMIDVLVAFLIFLLAFSSYQYERSIREAFLLQLKCQLEQERTQSILNNIFPPHVTMMLQEREEKNDIISHAEPSVSILFCDIQEFSDLMAHLSPIDLVATLNVVYSAFDVCSERFGVQKMETVGKTYMACAGLAGTRDDHALACVEMAMEMLKLMGNTALVIRIGINTGPVIAGVVGLTRPQYCLFGDTVNTASRHQSTGVKGRCSISQRTYDLVKHMPFTFESRTVTMKGKGQVRTWLVSPIDPQDTRLMLQNNPMAMLDEGDEDKKSDDSNSDIGESVSTHAHPTSLISMSEMQPNLPPPSSSTTSHNDISISIPVSKPSRTIVSMPLPGRVTTPPAALRSIRSIRAFVLEHERSSATVASNTSQQSLPLDGRRFIGFSAAMNSPDSPLGALEDKSVPRLDRSRSLSAITSPRAASFSPRVGSAEAPAAIGSGISKPPSYMIKRQATFTAKQSTNLATLAMGDSIRPEMQRILKQDESELEPDIDPRQLLQYVHPTTRQPLDDLNEAYFEMRRTNVRSMRFPLIIAVVAAVAETGFDEWSTFVGDHTALTVSLIIRLSIAFLGIVVLSLPFFIRAPRGENQNLDSVMRSNSVRRRPSAMWKAVDYQSSDSNSSNQSRSGRSSLTCSCCRLSNHHLRLIQMTFVVLAIVGMQLVTLINTGVMTTRSTLLQILYLTILNNVGSKFARVPYLFGILWFIWAITAFATAAAAGAKASNSVPSSDTWGASSISYATVLIWVAWIALASVTNIAISFGRELYLRKGFLLTRRVLSEQQKSDEFLYHMLPRNVALQLRSGENVVAEEFHNISLLYSDIVSFTEYSASSTPDRVVQLLSQLFTAFDRLNDVHNVYKVQTIGDAYVCCAGLPFLRQGTAAEHAKNCIRMGMAMLREINTVRTVEGGKVQMRIGIHVGTIVAGVVGTKKLRYDIWGLDAMVANACESNSQAGCILLSGEAAALVEDDFDLQPSVQFEVVGKKAPIKTFLLDPSKQLLAPIRAGTLESQGSTGILFSEH